ncbi:uncharacterized protein LOC133850811 [Drosophila sulfurigaster albostrigata]|uniref:uncharacterized protein LOC133850811 n=1 Tax=Drosophila sulfurigaster albostrigata TaxID=89887 RepID=UPI002D21A005|nr:uncharacterized protein LOC133850811 [Drosophila sulfurigaster albostrigata]
MRTTFVVAYLLAIVLNISEVYGGLGIMAHIDEAHPGKCVLDENTILDIGQFITRDCQLFHCEREGVIYIRTCQNMNTREPCTIGELKYPDADYPKCCTRIVHCPDGDFREI